MVQRFEVQGIDHVALGVPDPLRAAKWYQEVLGLKRLHEDVWGDFPVVIGAGSTSIALFPILGECDPPPGRQAIAMRHLAFRVDAANFVKAQEALRKRMITFEFQDHAISQSIYFSDTDGHKLEITTYNLEP